MIRERLLIAASYMGVALSTAILVVSLQANADGKPATDGVPRYIPYKGTLEKDGEPVSGSLSMTFSLFDGASDTTADWTETQTITVYAGQFSAMLGASSTVAAATLDAVVANADDLYLTVSLVSEGKTVALQNKQRFLPVPFALWAPSSTNLVIEGDDNTGSTAALIVRDPSANNLYVDGNEIESSGTLAINKIGGKTVQFGGGTEFTGWPTFYGTDIQMKSSTTTDGGRAFVRSADNLIINYAGDFGLVQVQGTELKHNGVLSADDGTVDFKQNAAVAGNLSVTGNATVTGTLTAGRVTKTCQDGFGTCSCDSGYHLMGGGAWCNSNTYALQYNGPNIFTPTEWVATCSNSSGNLKNASFITIICARID